MCELKRRYAQEHEPGVRYGLQAFLRFYELTQGNAKKKNYDDFVASQFYMAFVKFGRYCCELRVINFSSFLEYLLRNNKKIDHWCSDKNYEEWLLYYLPRESVQPALERGLEMMAEWSEKHGEDFNKYFSGSSSLIIHHITTGRISPWILFNCASGIKFLSGLNPIEEKTVMRWVDPDLWGAKLSTSVADVEWCKHILSEAGL